MTYNDYFEEGRKAYDAFASSGMKEANPYDAGTREHDQWEEGWEYEWGNYFGERE